MKNKVADIEAIVDKYKPDIILGNESWLNPDIASSKIFPTNYIVHRKDRIGRFTGGGVFQVVKKDLILSHRSTLTLTVKLSGRSVNLLDQVTNLSFLGRSTVLNQLTWKV